MILPKSCDNCMIGSVKMLERILTASLRDQIREAARRIGYLVLKEEQVDVLMKFPQSHDVFASLPTGFGKSVCYQSF